MPISIDDIARDERTFEFEFEGQTAAITYVPSKYTPNVEARYMDAIETKRFQGAMVQLLLEVMAAWDVVDADGEPLPITAEVLGALPGRFIAALAFAISEDIGSDGEERKNSDGGSRQAARSGKRRRGSLS